MRKLTTEQYKARISEVNKDIEIISEYIGANKPVTAKCKLDGNVWSARASMLYVSGCPKCDIKKRTKTTEQFKKEVEQINPNIEVIEEYRTSREKIKFRCKIEGTVWDAEPYVILSGCGCPECANKDRIKKRKKTIEDVKKQIKEIDKDIEIIGEYKNSLSKTKFRCKKCKGIWETSTSSIINNKSGCPKCGSKSKGEKNIRKYCEKNNIQYKEQYKIKDCKNKKVLPFDFALFSENKLIALIEYQGIQHYKPVAFFGGEREFKQRKINDKIKKDYCEVKNILLIEVPYWIEDVDEYIDKHFRNYKINMQTEFVI